MGKIAVFATILFLFACNGEKTNFEVPIGAYQLILEPTSSACAMEVFDIEVDLPNANCQQNGEELVCASIDISCIFDDLTTGNCLWNGPQNTSCDYKAELKSVGSGGGKRGFNG